MATKGTTVKSKTTAAKAAVRTAVKTAVKTSGVNKNVDWLTIAGLVLGGLSFLGYMVLSNITIAMNENIQIIFVIALAVFAMVGVVFSILAVIFGSKDFTKHALFGLNIIGLVISLLAFDKFLTPFISVISYLVTPK